MPYDPERHHRRSIRAKGHDYAGGGAYFVTMCVQGRTCLFGKVDDGRMVLNEVGEIVREEWFRSVEVRTGFRIVADMVMPNHLHGVVIIEPSAARGGVSGTVAVGGRADSGPPQQDGLPEGWSWGRLIEIAAIKGGLTKGQKRRPSDSLRSVPYLRVANVQRGYLNLSEVKEIDATEAEIRELRLEPGDVLFNEGGDRDKLGRGWIWSGQIADCIDQNHVFRARLRSEDINPKYVSWFGNSFGQEYFSSEGKQTTNLASINLTKLSAFPIPLPPAAEQHRIVAEVERRLSVVEELERAVAHGLRRAEKLRQAILRRAFEGKLAPQDPNDEPAGVLLERIRTERSAAVDQGSRSRKGGEGHQRGRARQAALPLGGGSE